jgi:hypothetical protein
MVDSVIADQKSSALMREPDSQAAVAEFIRTRGATRCPTACVLPTQASITSADRTALAQHAERRAERRRARRAARLQFVN